MDVGRPPTVDAIAKRIGARLDGPKEVIAVLIRDHPAAAAEIGIDRRNISIVAMTIAAAGIGLPHLDKRIGHRPAVAIEHMSVDDGLFADRLTLLGIVEDEVVIERTEFLGRKYRAGDLGQR